MESLLKNTYRSQINEYGVMGMKLGQHKSAGGGGVEATSSHLETASKQISEDPMNNWLGKAKVGVGTALKRIVSASERKHGPAISSEVQQHVSGAHTFVKVVFKDKTYKTYALGLATPNNKPFFYAHQGGYQHGFTSDFNGTVKESRMKLNFAERLIQRSSRLEEGKWYGRRPNPKPKTKPSPKPIKLQPITPTKPGIKNPIKPVSTNPIKTRTTINTTPTTGHRTMSSSWRDRFQKMKRPASLSRSK
jgi:hypothetical protein